MVYKLNNTSFMVFKVVYWSLTFSSVQSLSRVWLFATPWTAACQASLSITNFQSSPKPMFIELVMPSNHHILCHPLLLLPSIFPSIRVFSNASALRIRWPKYWSFSFNISPSSEYPGLISFSMDWLDLLAVQGTLKSLVQQHSSKASVLRCSAFFMESNILPLKKKRVYESNSVPLIAVNSAAIWLLIWFLHTSHFLLRCDKGNLFFHLDLHFFLLNQQLRVNSCLSQLLATLGKCQSPQSSPAQEYLPPAKHPGSTAVQT